MKGRLYHQHTHTHKVRQTRSFIKLNCLTYMSGYAFIYTNSRIKKTLMDPPLGGLILSSFTIDPNK